MAPLLSRKAMWDLTRNVRKEDKHSCLARHVQAAVGTDNLTKEQKAKISSFLSGSTRKFSNVGRIEDIFLSRYAAWLQCTVDFSAPSEVSEVVTANADHDSRGEKTFTELCDRSKRRRVSTLVASHPPEELAQAAQSALRKAGQPDSAFVVKQVTQTTPTRGAKFRDAYTDSQVELKKYSGEEALALLIELRLTKEKYKKLRQSAKGKNHDLYPSYDVLQEAKLKCYAPTDSIEITEMSAEITLQALLNKTTERLLESKSVNATSWGIKTNICLVSKYGFDGCSGQAEYQQNLGEGGNDRFMFLSSLVPLRFTCDEGVLWTNKRANSTRTCRPIRFQMVQETAELIRAEHNDLKRQIFALLPSQVKLLDGNLVPVRHELVLSMIDGKVVSTLTDTSSARCPNCQAFPKEMNHLHLLKTKVVNQNSLLLGLSPLHAHIRTLEYLLHVSYRIELKMRSVSGAENKAKMEARKKLVTDRFRAEMGGLLVDMVKPGAGNTNTGNTARRVFANPALSADILGLEKEVLVRFNNILSLISCSRTIKLKEFGLYCLKTYELIIEKYPWYFVPPSVHRLLMHAPDIMKESPLPTGMLSEEPQEARNKDYNYFREHHTRKISRKATNQDLFNMLMVSSDPVISEIYAIDKSRTRRDEFSEEAKAMIKDSISSSSSSEDENDSQ